MSGRGFGSDNHAGVHPQILAALTAVNQGHAPSYGVDPWTKACAQLLAKKFGAPLSMYFVFNGTGANVLALGGMLQSYQSCLVTDCSHLNSDECAAPEAIARIKLITAPHSNGKLRPEHLQNALSRRGDQHSAQLGAISLTQPTELGTLYSLAEIRELSRLAHGHGLLVHMDGARLVVAAERLGVSLAELTSGSGVDVVSFGGTKNALLFGECVLVFRQDLFERFRYLRKQMMQLVSKSRFVAAQFLALLQGHDGQELFRHISRQQCEMAKKLAEGLARFKEFAPIYPVQANSVFVCLPKHYVSQLRKKYFFYVWDQQRFEVRLMCSFDTELSEIEGFLQELDRLASSNTNQEFLSKKE